MRHDRSPSGTQRGGGTQVDRTPRARLPSSLTRPRLPEAILALQRSAGNAAVGALLLRRPLEEAEAQPAASGETDDKAVPEWYRLDSEQGPLPGDPVEGITGATRPLTETDRKVLESALDDRLKANGTRVPAFVKNYEAALLHVWTGFVTEQMENAIEESEWPEWAKLLSFVVRSSLLALLPEHTLVEQVGHRIAKLVEKDAEYTAEQVGEGVGAATRQKRVRRHKNDLVEQADVLSGQVAKVLDDVMLPLAQGADYRSWLKSAPLAELRKFRLPPLAPVLTRDQIELAVAEQMAGFAHTQRYGMIAPNQQNVIELRLHADRRGRIGIGHPSFRGAEAFAEQIAGMPVSSVPHVPMRVVLSGGPRPEDIVAYHIGYAHEVEQAFDVYPRSTDQIQIERYPDGAVIVNFVGMNPGGDLGVHLALAGVADPRFDVDAFVLDHIKGLRGASVLGGAAGAARQLHEDLLPLVFEGARQLMVDAVGPLHVD
jgi:hypothetical protein